MAWKKTFFENGKTIYNALVGNNQEEGIEEDKSKAESALTKLAEARYRIIFQGRALLNAQVATTTGITETGLGSPAGANGGLDMFYINPADYPAGSTLRVLLIAAVNAVAPVSNFTAALYPVTASAGAENAVSLTVGSQVSGSTAVITAPVAEKLAVGESGAVAMPGAAGFYILQIIVSANNAAKSALTLRARCEVKA